jgi:DNA-binding NarL/FixJ family response regulator
VSNGDIATQLGITLPAVKSHVAHVMDKPDASSRTQVVARAREGGLIA